MNWRKALIPLGLLALLLVGWRAGGALGLAFTGSGVVMWLLLHFTRLMQVMRRAAERPIGTVASAVMLNARLRRGVSLLHVVALTHALGERLSPDGSEPEVHVWRDAGGVQVRCEFTDGRLARWQLERPDNPTPTGQS